MDNIIKFLESVKFSNNFNSVEIALAKIVLAHEYENKKDFLCDIVEKGLDTGIIGELISSHDCLQFICQHPGVIEDYRQNWKKWDGKSMVIPDHVSLYEFLVHKVLERIAREFLWAIEALETE